MIHFWNALFSLLIPWKIFDKKFNSFKNFSSHHFYYLEIISHILPIVKKVIVIESALISCEIKSMKMLNWLMERSKSLNFTAASFCNHF